MPLTGAVLILAAAGIPATGIVSTAIQHYGPGLAHSIEIGSARLKLLPVPGIVADDISLRDPGNPQHKLAHVRRGVFQISVSRLISGGPGFRAITLNGTEAYVYGDSQGAGQPSPRPTRSASAGGADLAAAAAAAGRLKIEDGSLVFSAADGGTHILAHGVEAGFALHPEAGERMLDASGTVAGYRVTAASAEEQAGHEDGGTLPLRIDVRAGEGEPVLASASMRVSGDPLANSSPPPALPERCVASHSRARSHSISMQKNRSSQLSIGKLGVQNPGRVNPDAGLYADCPEPLFIFSVRKPPE